MDYIIFHPAMDHIGMYLHLALGILICKACSMQGCASNANVHIIDHHNGCALLHIWDHEEFNVLLAQRHYPATYKDIIHSAPCGPPIQKVEHKVSFTCTLSPPTCIFATIFQECMARHIASSFYDHNHYPNCINCYKVLAVIQTVCA